MQASFLINFSASKQYVFTTSFLNPNSFVNLSPSKMPYNITIDDFTYTNQRSKIMDP